MIAVSPDIGSEGFQQKSLCFSFASSFWLRIWPPTRALPCLIHLVDPLFQLRKCKQAMKPLAAILAALPAQQEHGPGRKAPKA
mmetsp:Transcript_51142/g.122482  ORF Transcript_51142/g.122482 Transcript_51142/m.122482 type:complete len:83 (-) Transcript_51142:8-256(-)